MAKDMDNIEIPTLLTARATFRDASEAARVFATENRCTVTVARRKPPLDAYWTLYAPAAAVENFLHKRGADLDDELDEESMTESERAEEAESERIRQQDIDYQEKLERDNYSGRYGTAYDYAPSYSYDRPDPATPW